MKILINAVHLKSEKLGINLQVLKQNFTVLEENTCISDHFYLSPSLSALLSTFREGL